MCCLIIVLGDFPALSGFDFLYNSCCRLRTNTMISLLLNSLRVFYGPECDLSGWMLVWAWEECGLCCFWMKYPIDVRSNWLLFGDVHFKYVISDLLPTCCISPFWGMAVLKSPNTVDSYISPWDSVIFASSHIGWCSFVSCIHINNWYVLDNWHFPLYEMPLLYLS